MDCIRFRSAHRALAVLLVLALLFAQGIGMQHRIVHAGSGAAGLHPLIAAVADDEASAHPAHPAHSCLLFDAAALGVTLHGAIFILPCARAAAMRIVHRCTLSWQALFRGCFSPRAPPFN